MALCSYLIPVRAGLEWPVYDAGRFEASLSLVSPEPRAVFFGTATPGAMVVRAENRRIQELMERERYATSDRIATADFEVTIPLSS